MMDETGKVLGLTGSADDPLSAAVMERDRATLAMVRAAIERRRLALAFQPVVVAADPTRIAFHEGLIRIMDEFGRPIPARDFMGQVESLDLGRLIDCAALDLGLLTLARVPDLRLSINMSARSIGYPRWMQTLRSGLAVDPTVGERLILEITESSAILMPEIVTAFMNDLQRQGIAFALDDFGAGYSAFRYLRDFYFDILKIDGSFIQGIATDPDNQVILTAMLSVGRHFDMLVVAEQIETAEDAAWVSDAGVDCLQGFFFGAPTVQPDWDNPRPHRPRARG